MITAAGNIFKFIIILTIDFLIKRKKVNVNPSTLLLIRLDAIGDYVLFRNFIKALMEDERYKLYKITLCGNIVWKDLAETFDKEIVDDFIWIDRMKYLNSPSYRYSIMKKVYESGFEVAIESIHSREILFGDSVIKASNSILRIGSKVNEKYSGFKKNLFSDSWYNRLLPVSNDITFEFYRNKQFFETLLEREIKTNLHLDVSSIPPAQELKNKFVLIFPGASRKERMWDADNFRSVADFILNEYSYNIVVSGSIKEKELGGKVKPDNVSERFINLCGNTLPQLAKLISDAELLISNDTSAVHFAAAVDTPSICIANGQYYGRFNPYPTEVYSKAFCVYPEKFTPGAANNINSISPEKVKSLVKEILS